MLQSAKKARIGGVEGNIGMILCDIGNSRIHFYDGKEVKHLSHEEGLKLYESEKVGYICVNDEVKSRIKRFSKWQDVSNPSLLKSDYKGLGIDRIALSLAICDGVVIDAGSAITVDVMEKGVHLGGWIWPGVKAFKEAYGSISAKLAVQIDPCISFEKIPKDTSSAISYAVLGSIKEVVQTFAKSKRVFVTGGDASYIAPLFEDAKIDELLIFKGMEKMIKEERC